MGLWDDIVDYAGFGVMYWLFERDLPAVIIVPVTMVAIVTVVPVINLIWLFAQPIKWIYRWASK